MLDRCGVYKITNLINKKIYVGGTVNLRRRRNGHVTNLNRQVHQNRFLQADWIKYGQKNFKFEVIEYVDNPQMIHDREQYWIDKLNVCDNEIGYNISPTAKDGTGIVRTEEFKEKISKFNKGKKLSPEVLANLIKINKEKKLSKDQIENLRQINTGNKYCLGKKHSVESIEKMKQSHMGKQHNVKLKKEDVKQIKYLILEGLTLNEIAQKFNVHPDTISLIKRGKVWADITIKEATNDEIKNIKTGIKTGEKTNFAKLKEKDVYNIKELLSIGKTIKEVAQLYNLHHDTIKNIKIGKSWKNVIFPKEKAVINI